MAIHAIQHSRHRAFFVCQALDETAKEANTSHNRRACSALRGIGGWAPNKRSAGSKTIALLANANCFTSALLANMFLDQHNNGRRRAEAFVDPSAQKQEQKKNIPKNGLSYNVPHQTNWTEKFPSSVARRWESS